MNGLVAVHNDLYIAVSLRFQFKVFLAHCAAMQQVPTIISAQTTEPTDEAAAVTGSDGSVGTLSLAVSLAAVKPPAEIGGRVGPEPTRFGDWEKAGRCIDF